MQGFLTVLPMAFVMSAGPQIVTATFLATSKEGVKNSLAFLGGVATATTIGVTIFYFVGGGLGGTGSSNNWLDYMIVALLALLIVRVFLKRKETEPPKWMGKLEKADAGFAAKIGFMLYSLMPTDLISMATVGAYLARQDEPWWHTLGFLALTLIVAGLPFLALILMGRRAETTLPAIRDWMNDNSWMVNEAVLCFFLVMALF